MCVCSLCYNVPTIVQSAQDINWYVLTEHKVTWATYKAV